MNDNPPNETDNVPSPCIRKCCLDANDRCVGCYRTMSEIIGWRDKTVMQKKAIITRAALWNGAER